MKSEFPSVGKDTEATNRRAFIGRALAATGTVGVAVAAGSAISATAADEPQAGAGDSTRPSGYRNTAHVSRYYQLARF